MSKNRQKRSKFPPKKKMDTESLQKREYNVFAGKKAVIALASRGIGTNTASKVIEKMRAGEEEFYRDILFAERDYVKTKKFWE